VPVAPLRRSGTARRLRRGVHIGGFRSVELNLVGWSAVLGTGLVVGTVAALVATVAWWVALPVGVATVWIGLLIADYRRWRDLSMGMGFGLTRPETASVAQELADKGLRVEYSELLEDNGSVQTGITFRHADERKVRRYLRDKGLDTEPDARTQKCRSLPVVVTTNAVRK